MSDSEKQQYTGLGWAPPNNKRPKPAKYGADFSVDTSANFSADFSADYGMGIETGAGEGTAIEKPEKDPS